MWSNDEDRVLSCWQMHRSHNSLCKAHRPFAHRALPSQKVAFSRNHSGCPSVIVALNLGDQPAAAILHGVQSTGRVVVSTLADRDGEAVKDEIDLRPHEGLLIELST